MQRMALLLREPADARIRFAFLPLSPRFCLGSQKSHCHCHYPERLQKAYINMVQSVIISSGSEASDNEESSHSGNTENKKTTRVTRTRGGARSSNRGGGRSSRTRRSSASIKHHVKHYVEHNYHDHLHDATIPGDEQEPDSVANHDDHAADENKKLRGGHRGGVAVPFPEKLHYMLSQMDQNETAHIVNWQPHGRCFVVHKPKEFVEVIMPRFFRQTKMTSFQRQLNLYGFSRLTAGPDRGGYYHELFLRGRLDLCKRMARTRVKGNGSKAASSPSTEPNLYSMESCHEQEPSLRDVVMPDARARLCEVVPLNEEENNVVLLDGVSVPPIVEDYDEDAMILFVEDPEAAEIVLKPIEDVIAAPKTETASWNSSPEFLFTPPLVATPPSSSTKSLPALVSPPEQTKPVISPSSSMSKELFAPLLAVPTLHKGKDEDDSTSTDSDQVSCGVDRPLTLHSGDEVFFEGLPFHYLETKDIEEKLHPHPVFIAGVQCSTTVAV